ncbi:hypothetical protein [Bordetella bronchialis]|uniref:Uncharacterized protein n=1 Tax=Bordetella bronchialis TaxID=463025 RepID=A0ABN4QZR6_9BORD|nr:hypothetical protein [Bordetella bronchialis]ANN66441.1 hypothetical protein BAU06_09170 [Bordetella bronchialis]
MAKRDYPLRFQCAHPDCRESVTYRFSTIRDLRGSHEFKWYSGGKWKCSRHDKPNEVLGLDNLETRYECVSREESHGRYWGNFGFMFGPGFKAWPKDFPAGTKIIVTARIELPPEDA